MTYLIEHDHGLNQINNQLLDKILNQVLNCLACLEIGKIGNITKPIFLWKTEKVTCGSLIMDLTTN